MAELKIGGTTTHIKSGRLVTYELTYFIPGTETPWTGWIRFDGRPRFDLQGGHVVNVNEATRAQAVQLAFFAELEALDLDALPI